MCEKENSLSLGLCSAGMGLYLAWTAGDSHSKAVAGMSGATAEHAVDIAAGIGCNILTLLVAVVFWKKIASIANRRSLCLLAGIFAVTGPLVVTGAQAMLRSTALMSTGSAMRGVAAALLFLAWSELTARLPLRQASICYGAAYLVSVIAQVAMGLMDPVWAMSFSLACAAASTVMLQMAASSAAGEQGGSLIAKDTPQRWTLPWRPLVLAGAYTLITFTFLQTLGAGSGGLGRLGGGAAAAICVLGCLLFFEKRFDATTLGVAALPLVTAAILLWCLVGDQGKLAVIALADAGNVAFRIFILSMLCNISYRYEVSPLWLFGTVRIAMMAAEGCGLGISMAAGLSQAGTSWLVQPICYVTVIALIVICTSAQDVRSISETSWCVFGKDTGSQGRAGQLRSVMSEQELVLWHCSKVARAHGLTHREEEILSYLASDMTYPQIAKELVLTEDTVRTHVRHLYGKLGVHSRQEAVARLNEA